MKLWWPLLAVLPAGLLLGLVGGRMVDSSRPRDPAAQDSAVQASPSALAPAYSAAAIDDSGFPQTRDERPDLDWDAQYWPQDYDGGAYALDDDYFGSDDADFADSAPDARAGSAGEAVAAAQAAERAAGDAVRAARVATPSDTAPRPLARSAEMPIATSREPRAADGDLPAIW